MTTIISIREKDFYFEPLVDWPRERLGYIRAWKLAFGRDGYEDRIDWLIGSRLNKTYVLRDQKGSIAAAYSLIENLAVDSGSILNSAICNNVFCIPEYQGLNLFVRIGRLSLADSASAYAFGYGFPNQAAIAGHKRVGWECLDNAFNISIKLVNGDKSDSLDANFPSPVLAEQLTEDKRQEVCTKMADIALNKALAKGNLTITKSEEYIHWRFFVRPKTEDRSYYVLSTKDSAMLFSVYHPRKQINILDIQASDDSNESALLKSLVHFSYSSNIQSIKLFGCRESKLAVGIKTLINNKVENIQYESVIMIVNTFGREQAHHKQLRLPCSMSFLDNDVY